MKTSASLVHRSAQIIYSATKDLIRLSSIYQDEFRDYYKSDRHLSFMKEFCTIKVCGPRQSGHSTAIQFLTFEFDKPCVISWTLKMSKRIKEGASPNTDFASVKSLTRLAGKTYDIIFVDTASLLSKTDIENVYDAAAPCLKRKPSFLIFME